MNFLTSPKSSYSPEVVFTICDVRKVDSNRFNRFVRVARNPLKSFALKTR